MRSCFKRMSGQDMEDQFGQELGCGTLILFTKIVYEPLIKANDNNSEHSLETPFTSLWDSPTSGIA